MKRFFVFAAAFLFAGMVSAAPQAVAINGDFANAKLKKNVPEGWRCEYTKDFTMVKVNGKSAVQVKYTGKNYATLLSNKMIPMKKGQVLTVKFTVSGKGRLAIGAGWYNSKKNWAVNDHRPYFPLTAQPKTVTVEFAPDKYMAKDPKACRIQFIMPAPGGEMIMEKVEATLR